MSDKEKFYIDFRVDRELCPWAFLAEEPSRGFYGYEAIGRIHHYLEVAVEDATLVNVTPAVPICAGDHIYSSELDLPIKISKIAHQFIQDGTILIIYLDLNSVKDVICKEMAKLDENEEPDWDILVIRDLTDCKLYSGI